MSQVTLFCFWASYVAAWGIELARSRWDNWLTRWGGWIALAAGILAHTVYLMVRSQRVDLPPLLGSPQDYLLVFAWLVVVTLLVLARILPSISLGSYLLPPAIAIVSVAAFADDSAGSGTLQTAYWWVFAHSAVIVIGLVGVLLAFATSLMYLRQHRRLKLRRPAATGAKLLSLETLSRVNWWCIVLSVPLISIGFAMGTAHVLASTEAAESVPLTGPPIVMLFVLWIGLIGLMAWILIRPQVGGTAIAIRTAWACGFVLATFLSLNLFGREGGLHGQPTPAPAATSLSDETGSRRSA